MVFGDVAQPQLVRGPRGEVAAHQVFKDRRTWLAELVRLPLVEPREPAVGRVDPPRGLQGCHLTGIISFIGEERVPMLGATTASSAQRVRPIRLDQLTVTDRIGQPSITRLASKPWFQTRDGDGDLICGQLTHERVEPFPGRPAYDKYAAGRRT